ncbi:MAG TPA: glucosaminidase domain-containing protein [Reyranella sp.]|nr:glucosaminidase domain-containing protein [Reyranella sp.]
MASSILPALDRGRFYAFPVVWVAVLTAGVGLREPQQPMDAKALLSFKEGPAAPKPPSFLALNGYTSALTFVRHDAVEAEDTGTFASLSRDIEGGHGRFAAPGNAVRRQVQLRPINPRTSDELAGFFRDASYTLTDVRQGEAVPPIRVERVPDDLVYKDGNIRKSLFITALLPVILEVNQRVLVEREQLLYLRGKLATTAGITSIERFWLEQLATKYDTPADKLDELVRRVDIVPPSMAIAQSGVESGWGTSFAARSGNALFGQIQSAGNHAVSVPWRPGAGMPQPFANVGEAAEAYVVNLNTHPAYSAFRAERAAMRERGESIDGYKLVGQLVRYSELGQQYVGFIRQVIRDDKLTDFDKAKLSSF